MNKTIDTTNDTAATEIHYGYGSGSAGCMYDNGPNYAGTNKREAAYSALYIFQDDMSQKEYSEAVKALVSHGIWYFRKPRKVGASVVEVFEVDPTEWLDEDGEPLENY